MNIDAHTAEVLHNYPVVKQESCVMHYKCANCMAVCQAKAVRAVSYYSDDRLESKKTAFIDGESCTKCGLCYQVCPTNAIEDVNAIDYRAKAFALAKQGTAIIFACEHTDFNSELLTPHSELITAPDISIISWRSILKILSMGSAITLIGCNECRQTNHFKQIEEIFANSCYEGVFRVFERGDENIHPPLYPLPSREGKVPSPLAGEAGTHPKDGWGEGGFLDENILEQIITSYAGKIPFPGTAWVDIGDRCTLCQNCANVCPTSALSVRKTGAKLSLMYDHNLCKGCPICEKACPERCITIDRRLRLNKLAAIDVKCESNMLFCKGCDKPISADAAFERIKNILSAHGMTTEQLAYCPDCKGNQLIGMTN